MLSDLAGKQTDLIGYMKLAFANIAFGTIGVLSVFINKGIHTQAVVLLGYAVYLLQTAGLHGFRYFTESRKSPARLWRSCIATFFYAGLMAFFAIRALFWK
jgi:hypothetical protein